MKDICDRIIVRLCVIRPNTLLYQVMNTPEEVRNPEGSTSRLVRNTVDVDEFSIYSLVNPTIDVSGKYFCVGGNNRSLDGRVTCISFNLEVNLNKCVYKIIKAIQGFNGTQDKTNEIVELPPFAGFPDMKVMIVS